MRVKPLDETLPLRANQRMALWIANRPYRLLLSASAVTNLGDGVSALAIPWLAALITRDPVLIAFVAFAARLPWLLFAIPAGILIDRGDRRRLMVQADISRSLLNATVVALIISIPAMPPVEGGGFYVTLLAGLAFLIGSAEVIRDNAAQTILPSIVDKKDLENANGQMWSVEQIMGSFIGPPLAGILIGLAVPAPFAMEVAAFAIAAWLVWCITLRPRIPRPRRSMLHEVKEGFAWMRAHPVMLRLAFMLCAINMLYVMAVTVLVLISKELFGLSAFGHGMLLISGAAGGVLAGVFSPKIIETFGQNRSIQIALLLFPLPFAVIGVATHPAIIAAALAVETFAGLLWNIVTVSYRQRLIPDELLGRVNSLYRFFAWGMMSVGALIGGWIVIAAEPFAGRELALRAPYLLAALGSVGLLIYGRLRLKL
jgi:MFS family permease